MSRFLEHLARLDGVSGETKRLELKQAKDENEAACAALGIPTIDVLTPQDAREFHAAPRAFMARRYAHSFGAAVEQPFVAPHYAQPETAVVRALTLLPRRRLNLSSEDGGEDAAA